MKNNLDVRTFFWQLLTSIGYSADKKAYCDYLEERLSEELKIIALSATTKEKGEYLKQQLAPILDFASLQQILRFYFPEEEVLEMAFYISKKVFGEIFKEINPLLNNKNKQQLRNYLVLALEQTNIPLPKLFRTRREI